MTRLLQDSLGGNTKTLMISTIGPSGYNYNETLSTLRYSNRAKNIRNKPRINENKRDELLREYEEEIMALRAQLMQANQQGSDTSPIVIQDDTSPLPELQEDDQSHEMNLDTKCKSELVFFLDNDYEQQQ